MTQKKKTSTKKPASQNDFLHTIKQSKNPFAAVTSKKSANPPQQRRFSRTK